MRLTALGVLLGISILVPQTKHNPRNTFDEGCCVNNAFSHPKHPVSKKLDRSLLLSALNCSTNNQFIGTSRSLARKMRTGNSLEVAYFYGHYMPDQDGDALTTAVYSRDGRSGYLFDAVWQKDGTMVVLNIPDLLKDSRRWRVGEIDGGLWSYTRLYYLAQDIGNLPRSPIPISDILAHRPPACWVLVQRQWDDLHSKTKERPRL